MPGTKSSGTLVALGSGLTLAAQTSLAIQKLPEAQDVHSPRHLVFPIAFLNKQRPPRGVIALIEFQVLCLAG